MLRMKVLAFLSLTLLSVRADNGAGLIQQAMKSLPPCALICMSTEISKSKCGLSDTPCIAQDPALIVQLEECVRAKCTIREALTAKNFTATAFGAPIRDHTRHVIYIGMIPGGIAVLAVVLRIFARLPCCGGTWGLDDWAIIATTLPTLPLTGLSVVIAQKGLGKDIWTVPFDDITSILHLYYFDEIFYIAAIALTKISILLFYLRIFPNRTFRRCSYILITACVLFMLAFIPASIAQCIPVRVSWLRWDGEHSGQCINLNALAWVAAAINIVLDILVVVLPVGELFKLKMSMRRKAGISFMFLGGTFITIVSVVRLTCLIRFAASENVTWDYTPVGYWSTLEVHVGIIVACLPALRSLQHRLFPSTKTPADYYIPSGTYSSKGAGETVGGGRRSGLTSILSKSKSRRNTKSATTASQTSIMASHIRSKADNKEFIPLEDYHANLDSQIHSPHQHTDIIGRGRTKTHIERASIHDDCDDDQYNANGVTFLDVPSITQPSVAATRYSPRPSPSPHDAITVKKEYSVNIEYGYPENDSLSSSPPRGSEEQRYDVEDGNFRGIGVSTSRS